MRTADALRLTAASLVLALASCDAVEDPSMLVSAAKKPNSCLAAEPVPLVPAGGSAELKATIQGDTTAAPNQPELCGDAGLPIHRPSYYALTVGGSSALYVDTIGSEIDTVVGLLANGCGERPSACSDDACGSTQSQLVRIVPPGSYLLAVGGKDARDRGRFTLNVQLVRVPSAPAGEIPHGDFALEGMLQVGGSWLGVCGGALAASWWWYASCPGESGSFWAQTSTVFSKGHAALWWVDVDDGEQVCAPLPGTGLVPPYRVEALDESEGGLHVLEIGVVDIAMGFPAGEAYLVTGHRP